MQGCSAPGWQSLRSRSSSSTFSHFLTLHLSLRPTRCRRHPRSESEILRGNRGNSLTISLILARRQRPVLHLRRADIGRAREEGGEGRDWTSHHVTLLSRETSRRESAARGGGDNIFSLPNPSVASISRVGWDPGAQVEIIISFSSFISTNILHSAHDYRNLSTDSSNLPLSLSEGLIRSPRTSDCCRALLSEPQIQLFPPVHFSHT